MNALKLSSFARKMRIAFDGKTELNHSSTFSAGYNTVLGNLLKQSMENAYVLKCLHVITTHDYALY